MLLHLQIISWMMYIYIPDSYDTFGNLYETQTLQPLKIEP